MNVTFVLDDTGVLWQYALVVIRDIVCANAHDVLVAEALQPAKNLCDERLACEIYQCLVASKARAKTAG